eukprot:scaffold256052_cov33-Tisochrysis_lutea.AAC.2
MAQPPASAHAQTAQRATSPSSGEAPPSSSVGTLVPHSWATQRRTLLRPTWRLARRTLLVPPYGHLYTTYYLRGSKDRVLHFAVRC